MRPVPHIQAHPPTHPPPHTPRYAAEGYTFDPLKERRQKEALERRKAEEVRPLSGPTS